MQTKTSITQESITATRMLSVTTLKALTIVHANQDILEMALTAQVNIVTKTLIAKTLALREKTWNELPDNVVGVINDEGSQSFKAVLITIF